MYSFKRAIAALTAAVCVTVAPVHGFVYADGGSAEQGAAVTADGIAASSIIYYPDMSRVLTYGELADVEASECAYVNGGGVEYASLSWLSPLCGLTYTWDGASKTAAITHTKSGKSCTMPFSTSGLLADGGATGFFFGSCTYVPIKTLCAALGWGYYTCGDFWAISDSLDLASLVTADMNTELLNKGKTVAFACDFEGEEPLLKERYESGGGADHMNIKSGVTEYEGNKCLQIGASALGGGGVHFELIPVKPGCDIQVEYDVLKTADFAGAGTRMYVHAYKNGVFVAYVDGVYQSPEVSERWTHYSKTVKASAMPEGANQVFLCFATTRSTTSADKSAGRALFDNVRVLASPVQREAVTPNVTADKLGSWYVLGETVTLTPENKLDEDMYKEVLIDFYDSFNNLVYSDRVKTSEFNGGYKWTPTEQGYYEYDMRTLNKYGALEDLNEFYSKKNSKTGEMVRMDIPRNSFVVVHHATKPMEERSDRLAVSMEAGTIIDSGKPKGIQGDQIEIADLLGFRKIRFHFIRPDGRTYAKKSQSNPRRGDFDFTEWDGSVEHAKKYGFELVLNLMGIPRYVTPYRDDVVTPAGKVSMAYAPVDMEGWRSFVEYAVKRYKDDCRIWEIWNEPHVYGGSTFWQGIVPDYAKIQKIGYDVVKKYQPGSESDVLLGGIGARRYTNFYEQFVQTEGYDAFDVLPLHGFDADYWTYQNIAKDYGKEPKRICSTELHMMLRNTNSEYLYNTEKEESIRMMVEFLKDFKYGAEFTTFFQISMSTNIEWLRYVKENGLSDGALEGGVYYLHHYQPRFVAIAMNTFFDTIGKQYDYVDEYLLMNNKQNVVRVNSNGKDQLIVWNEGGSKAPETTLASQIINAAAEDFKVIDWEYHEIDTSDKENIKVKPETVYFISGLDPAKLDLIESGKGEELYTGKVLYNSTARQMSDKSLVLNHLIDNADNKPLFDKNTFALADGIDYIDNGWYWVPVTEGAQQGDMSAKYALSVAEDGMYLAAKVKDSTEGAAVSYPAELSNADSLEFAFDTSGDRAENHYAAYYVGIANGKPVVYKKVAPDIGGDMISNFITADNVVPDAKVSVTRAGGETTYLVYLPSEQLQPYERDLNSALNFAVLVNQNNGAQVDGRLEWGSGIKEANPIGFASVWLDPSAAEEKKVYYPPFAAVNNKPLFDRTTFKYADGINWITDNYNYVSLSDEAYPDYKAKTAVGVTEEGLYLAAEVEDKTVNMEIAKTGGGMYNADSMQFAIDPEGRGISDGRFEFQFGRLESGEVALYKGAAPFMTEEKTPEGYSNAGAVLDKSLSDITVDGSRIIYKAFIPAAELYPYDFTNSKNMKISFLFNQNEDGSRRGYLEWASGIGAAKDAKMFGLVRFK